MSSAAIERAKVPIGWLVAVICTAFTGLGSAVTLGFYVRGVEARAEEAKVHAVEAKTTANAATSGMVEANERLARVEGILESVFPDAAARQPRRRSSR